MQKLELKIDDEKVIIRYPTGVIVMVDFTNLNNNVKQTAGAVEICGVRLAVKPMT